jgi:hypothetical protein
MEPASAGFMPPLSCVFKQGVFMDVDKWLATSAALDTETRVSLENLVISQEGFFDKAKEFIFGSLGKSLKGDDYKPVRLEHTYNFKSTMTAISRQYGNKDWLRKQNWVKSKVEGSDLLPYLDQIFPEQLREQVVDAGTFCITVHREWLAAVTAYFKAVKPVVEALTPGLTDEALDKALKLLKGIPEVGSFYKNPPRVFPVGDRLIPKAFNLIKPPVEVAWQARPLNYVQTETLVASILEQLEELNTLRDAFTRVSFDVVGPVQTRPFIQLCHSKNPQLPKGSQRKLKDWIYVSTRLDPAAMYWGSEEFAVVRRYYGDVLLASCRWIDRSIK